MKEKILVQYKEFDQLSTESLLELLNSDSRVNRVRALSTLARRSSQDGIITASVLKGITEPKNREARLLGSTISVSHVGFAVLWEFGPPDVRECLQKLLKNWPEPDRTDLLWFLKSQSISIDSGSISSEPKEFRPQTNPDSMEVATPQ
jgi:hypothetical protein